MFILYLRLSVFSVDFLHGKTFVSSIYNIALYIVLTCFIEQKKFEDLVTIEQEVHVLASLYICHGMLYTNLTIHSYNYTNC